MAARQSKIKGIALQFLIADLERALEFYMNKLGFEKSFQYEDFYAGVARDDQIIQLKLADPEDLPQPKGKDNLDVNIAVEGIEALYEEWTNQAVEMRQPLREMPYGREFYIADPEGHVLGFVE